jgi:hypothetical protein
MSETCNNGGYAFPVAWPAPHVPEPGMSLRDWFAGQALGHIISVTSAGQHQPGRGPLDERPIQERIAGDAYAMADAMLAARKAEGATS